MKQTLWIIAACVCLAAPVAHAQQIDLTKVKIDQRLDAAVPLDLKFRDAEGKEVTLASCTDHKTTLLMLGYYQCPMLCGLMLQDLPRTLNHVPFTIGKDYQFVMVSIAPNEKPALAAERRGPFVSALKGTPESAGQGVYMLTGQEPEIRRLADAVGYGYAYDQRSGQYAHPTGLVVLTPEGRVSRYLLGMIFNPRDVRLALLEGSEGKIGSLADGVLQHCYQYDPETGTYGLAIMTTLRIAGGLTVLMLGGLITLLTLHQRKVERLRTLQPSDAP